MNDELPLMGCVYADEKELYQAYMPFVQGGGLFIRTTQDFQLGDRVNLTVQLPNAEEQCLIEGKVVWLTPKGAGGNKPIGIGVQFTSENGRLLSNKIETCLAGMLKSTQMTDTL
ncbi:PilZ domain-containing protein [Legionella oakridgensis]|uniref:Tfp pilus assembly protein PilZ n=2 Tax=Legionella oakridgensis TaxID=29423 RepID=W0BE44_9GAMM|nr:PilZ domain-containing protein [Legionella oakridgensis]AHE66689.1 Tfp pilus assembly protein PilZ [Legionella oakridgensis ATCC 33761 = DSM 21215]ETO93563.1 Tfp pilus assembly protein PilZ [Legionella oakridgensis RV-2-2007]KTD37721.1 type 4 fimbrial biogenesis protein PilZ [Legionella oakridgensis]STY19827.1 type 4 fimbrial biogenesis protein PilZ [Legionella longbeachae]